MKPFPNISSLQQLEYLNLSACDLTVTIPVEISNLENIRVLDIWKDLLTGHIPSVVGSLNGLTYIDLSINNLIGDIPMELLRHLETILMIYFDLLHADGLEFTRHRGGSCGSS